MRTRKVYTYDIDLDGNRLLNAVLHPEDVFPESPVEGQIVNKSGVIHHYHQGEWKPVGAQVGRLRGEFDADAETQLPSLSLAEDYWWVTNAGTVNTLFDPQLEAGTMIIAKIDNANPLDPADWIILRVGGGHASLTEYGLVRLASVEETREGEDQEKVITPFTLAGMKAADVEVVNPLQDKRFVTPRGLFKVLATDQTLGLVRMATQQEVDQGEKDDVAVSPKTLKAQVPTLEKKNIHDAVMLHLNLISPDNTVWRIQINNEGTITTTVLP